MIGKRFVRRSWGWYWTILDRSNFKIKLLRFRKDGQLSLQYHYHRSELWLFLSGHGYIDGGLDKRDVSDGCYVTIKQGVYHRYTAYKPTFILEIQYGEKCEESDIVRL